MIDRLDPYSSDYAEDQGREAARDRWDCWDKPRASALFLGLPPLPSLTEYAKIQRKLRKHRDRIASRSVAKKANDVP